MFPRQIHSLSERTARYRIRIATSIIRPAAGRGKTKTGPPVGSPVVRIDRSVPQGAASRVQLAWYAGPRGPLVALVEPFSPQRPE
jgi:hypothetical protein